jgi:hypothetical protein
MIQPVPTRTSRTFWTFLFSYPDRRRSQALDYRSSIICRSRPFISEHIKVSKRRIIYRLPPPPLRLTAVTVITSKLPAISCKDVYCSLSPDRAAAIPWPRSKQKEPAGGRGGNWRWMDGDNCLFQLRSLRSFVPIPGSMFLSTVPLYSYFQVLTKNIKATEIRRILGELRASITTPIVMAREGHG